MAEEFKNEQNLLNGVLGFVNLISRDELEAVLEEQPSQLDECIQRAGEYVEQGESSKPSLVLRSFSYLFMPNNSGTPCMLYVPFVSCCITNLDYNC
jgi:hypothetical protein